MSVINEQEKRDSLNEILIELSKSQDLMKNTEDRDKYFVRLESVYYNCNEENFRHYYSDIFSTLTLIDGDSSIGSLDILAQNIQTIKKEYTQKNYDENREPINISKEIAKLYDQVQKKQEDMQKEYITILGIFAAIVLAFTGGMAFSSSVLENIDKSSIYRIVLIALIIGLVFFNLIWLLIDFIRDINGNGIRKKWLWALVNLIFLVGIIGVCFAYKYGWFHRNQNIACIIEKFL